MPRCEFRASVLNNIPAGWYDPETGLPCNPFPPIGGGGSSTSGTGNVNTGGGGGGTYSTTLNAILSGLALWQHANYVPTPLGQGQTPYGAQPPQPTIQYVEPSGNVAAGGTPRTNAFGGIQQYIQDHPLPVLGGVILIAALLMKPPVRANYR